MKNTLEFRCYDNGGKTLDRYTVVYMFEPESNGTYGARSMCAHPTSPQVIGCYTSASPGRHLGRRIKFNELPIECRKLVLSDLQDETESL